VNKNINITLSSADNAVKIYADEEKLLRALTNVISNCIRYAKTEISISLINTSDNRIRIEISDDGPGIDSKELPYVFERFFKGKKGNFGLGLAISKNIILKHNGNIEAENTESGALFIIELPVSYNQIRLHS
jgi:signal transduction histidine kinase